MQIPVQIDEKKIVDWGTIYNMEPWGFTLPAYADTSTFTGADPDTTFDADDELVFMAKSAGSQAAGIAEPPGTIAGSGIELLITDPIGTGTAYVYLFESDGTLAPGAGADSIAYDFNLLSGYYKTTYNTQTGPNPENSYITTSAYVVYFADRWIRDETRVTKGGATGVDMLDRHKNLFGLGNCGRSEDTFSAGEGAFIVNRTGPVRALRGYCGCNSGPMTHRIHAFYEEREDLTTYLRVHAISGMMDYFDYSPNADSMIYRNSLNQSGVLVDGVPDVVTSGAIIWEMITGNQGTLAITPSIFTDIPDFTYTSYYSDDENPPVTQCTGDDYEYGASGLWIDHGIPNTDPYLGTHYIFEASRIMTYGPPNEDLSSALARTEEANNPLEVDASPYSPVTAVEDYDGIPGAGDLIGLSLWPNPAGQNVSIRFEMRSRGPITIDLYDVTGRLVKTLAEGVWGAGGNDISSDLSKLPVGVYFIRAIGPRGAAQTSRIVILR